MEYIKDRYIMVSKLKVFFCIFISISMCIISLYSYIFLFNDYRFSDVFIGRFINFLSENGVSKFISLISSFFFFITTLFLLKFLFIEKFAILNDKGIYLHNFRGKCPVPWNFIIEVKRPSVRKKYIEVIFKNDCFIDNFFIPFFLLSGNSNYIEEMIYSYIEKYRSE